MSNQTGAGAEELASEFVVFNRQVSAKCVPASRRQ